ncbi:DNA directed RNA polymerase subunit delta [Spiroplasma sabaudiense Ar-1343]|uniref:RNAP delta factor n=1 Tax=Spiroplasma sabaudiense Ar-1343 TaxID=1276257 RepID=W6AB17_9MOLU|nr:DNA-directed RNA polymerase subunit delta [Spiroplasma sabaudiense]AHI54222.1 DNA directed RNA polymerase subunit delta [Spiroplasma sabaudiense Ar-1343]
MAIKLSNIEMAFDFLKNSKESATFEEIWNSIANEIHGGNEKKNQIIAELYTDLVLDNRFALTSDGQWGLRDHLKFDDVKKQYDYVDKFETTEEFEDIDSYLETDIYETDDLKVHNLNTIHDLDIDDDDDDDEDDDEDDDSTDEDIFDDIDD